jgi:hypothetical protein
MSGSVPRLYLKRSCRWQNDREFCARVERHRFRLLGLGAVGLLALNAGAAVLSLLHF